MNKLFKRAACLAVTAAMTLSSSGALACTGYYVGKQASASGHTIIGHTVDAWNTAQAKQVVYPHSEEPGRTVTVGANEVPLPVRMWRTARPRRGSAAILRRFPPQRAKRLKTTARSWKPTAAPNPTRL